MRLVEVQQNFQLYILGALSSTIHVVVWLEALYCLIYVLVLVAHCFIVPSDCWITSEE